MEQLVSIVVAIITTMGGVIGSYLILRRQGKLGIGIAEQTLSDTLQKTMAAQSAEIASLGRQLDAAQSEILDLEHEKKDLAKENDRLSLRVRRLEIMLADRSLDADPRHSGTKEG